MKLDPPPTQIADFNMFWKTWLNNLFVWNKSVDATIPPKMTTAERDAMTAENGMIIYNTTTNAFNFYEAGAWVTK